MREEKIKVYSQKGQQFKVQFCLKQAIMIRCYIWLSNL